MVANVWLVALDQHLGACVPPFTEEDLLAHNNLAYGGSDTLVGQIGHLHRFVESFPAPGEPLFADGFECGSTVGWTLDLRPHQFGVAVGCFNDRNFPPPVASIWEEEMCAWATLPAGIRHFPRARPA